MLERNTVLVAMFSMSLLGTTLGATPLLITNPGFEDDVLADGNSTLNSFASGWTVDGLFEPLGAAGALNPTAAQHPSEAPEGSNVAYIRLDGIQQTLAATLEDATRYTLSVEVGSPLGLGFAGYSLGLFAGNNLLAHAFGPFPAPTDGEFVDIEVQFLSLGSPFIGQPIRIQLQTQSLGPDPQTNFDNVRLDATAVPEPSSLALFAVGLLLCALLKCREPHSRTTS